MFQVRLSSARIGYLFLLLFAFICLSPKAFAQALPTGCPTPPAPTGKAWYVDPINGSTSGDGSRAHPWHTLAEVISAGLISSQQYTLPYNASSPGLKPKNPSGPIHGGDVIYLLNGNHGYIYLSGLVNTNFISIQALPGQNPVIGGLYVSGASHWSISGLTIQNVHGNLPGDVDGYLVYLVNGFTGPADNIYIANNSVSSAPANVVSSWANQDWLNNASNGVIVYGPSQVTITGNLFQYVAGGAGFVTCNNVVFQSNTIDTFGEDGIDIKGDNLLIRGNRLTNNRNLGDLNHNDMLQGQIITSDIQRIYSNIYIDANTMIESTTPANFQYVDTEYCHGIGVFDGNWQNFNVTNNFIVVATWHGISLSGVNGGTIINNTVLSRFAQTNEGYFGANPNNMAWIGVFNKKATEGGNAPVNVTVRNNVSMNFNLGTTGVTADHNTTAIIGTKTDPSQIFVAYNQAQAQYDAHINLTDSNNPILGTGSTVLAPTTDITGGTRVLPMDEGAYAAHLASVSSGGSSGGGSNGGGGSSGGSGGTGGGSNKHHSIGGGTGHSRGSTKVGHGKSGLNGYFIKIRDGRYLYVAPGKKPVYISMPTIPVNPDHVGR
jgi:hypothetical protein